MSAIGNALRSKHCAGCHRTVDLVPTGGPDARCPVCGRVYTVDLNASVFRMPAIREPARVRGIITSSVILGLGARLGSAEGS